MLVTLKEQWSRWHAEGKYTTLPFLMKVSAKLEDRSGVASWEGAWKDASPYAFVLESGKTGRYSYLGLHPDGVIRGKGLSAESIEFSPTAEELRKQAWEGKPLDVVRQWMSGYIGPVVEDGPKWCGGCVGFWGYDVARSIERLPAVAADDTGLPDYLFMRMSELWIVDHEKREVYCSVHKPIDPAWNDNRLSDAYDQAAARAEEMSDYWLAQLEGEEARSKALALRERRLEMTEDLLQIDVEAVSGIHSPFTKDAFMSAVERIQQYIGQGDVFQANLSQRLSRAVQTSPDELYEWLRLFNPSPYMGFLRCPDFQLVSASPELLVEMNNGKLATRPIAGTRRRGRTEEEDLQFAEELRTNEKERAEHIMLVDLERNDLGRISAYGTVKVKELMVIERYSHVMHLVSQVEGELADNKDAYDVIAATFPGGTITGAPKIRTMEIIEELEPVRRGPYTGSLGWIDYNGNMEFNIIIRTMAIHSGVVHIQAGAGIVIDSIPEREYYESLSKAKALWKAIQYSERFAELSREEIAGEREELYDDTCNR